MLVYPSAIGLSTAHLRHLARRLAARRKVTRTALGHVTGVRCTENSHRHRSRKVRDRLPLVTYVPYENVMCC